MDSPAFRITIIGLNYRPEPTGIAPYTSGLAESLADSGHHVTVITTHPHYPQWRVEPPFGQWSKIDLVNGVRVKRLRHYVPQTPGGPKRLLAELSFGLRTVLAHWNDPDIVVVVSPALFSSAMAVARAKLGRRRPVIRAWVQDLYSLGVRETATVGWASATLITKLEARVLQSVDGVAVIHDRFKGYVVASLGVAEPAVKVIRNWTHAAPPPEIDRDAERARLGWRESETIVLHAGAQGAKQGLENVVEAARLADAQGADIRFVLLGDGSRRSDLQQLARGVERVDFIDPLPGDEFQKALSAADVLLVNERPGLNEMAVPSKLTSYFNSGVPVLAATDPGSVTADELRSSGGGLRVDAGDPAALVTAALRLGTETALAQELADSGRDFQQRVLTADHALREFEQWIRSRRSEFAQR